MTSLMLATLTFERPVPIHDALLVAQGLRRATLSLCGPDAPSSLTGHEASGPAQGHRHPYWLPCDRHHDGTISACLVLADDPQTLATIAQVTHLVGPVPAMVNWEPTTPVQASEWVSATPWVPLRFPHGPAAPAYIEQIQTECGARGLPVPQVLAARPTEGWRTRPGWPRQHILWHLQFPQPILGPFALGRGAHSGLGLFQPGSGEGRF